MIKKRALGKINLSLNIKSRREDGYHELESIMLPIEFYDELFIEYSDEDIYECMNKNFHFDEKNTIVKAVNLLREKYNIKEHFKISLNKHLPTQAGLAGGSTDGACTIHLINSLCNLNMSDEDIKEVCNKIGADVIFTYYSKPALVEGIGDKLSFFNIKDDYYVLLVKPRKGVSTKDAYENLNLNLCEHPDISSLKKALEEGKDIDGLLGNSLEEPAFRLCEDIKMIKEELINLGAKNVLMSGSGSTVFTISKDYKELEYLTNIIKEKGYFYRFCRVIK